VSTRLGDWNRTGNRPLAEKPSMMEGAMEIVFWVIVAIVALAVVYVCAFRFGKRKPLSDLAPDPQEHGVDLQARRKTYDDVT
jgi:hypothetical protein